MAIYILPFSGIDYLDGGVPDCLWSGICIGECDGYSGWMEITRSAPRRSRVGRCRIGMCDWFLSRSMVALVGKVGGAWGIHIRSQWGDALRGLSLVVLLGSLAKQR
jgi:hypothetical protein